MDGIENQFDRPEQDPPTVTPTIEHVTDAADPPLKRWTLADDAPGEFLGRLLIVGWW